LTSGLPPTASADTLPEERCGARAPRDRASSVPCAERSNAAGGLVELFDAGPQPAWRTNRVGNKNQTDPRQPL